MRNKFKAETLISTLAAAVLFSVIFLGYSHWRQNQTGQLSAIYQQQQALQIAENQISLKLAGMPCETQLRVNNLTFTVRCVGDEIQVGFPLGEVHIIVP